MAGGNGAHRPLVRRAAVRWVVAPLAVLLLVLAACEEAEGDGDEESPAEEAADATADAAEDEAEDQDPDPAEEEDQDGDAEDDADDNRRGEDRGEDDAESEDVAVADDANDGADAEDAEDAGDADDEVRRPRDLDAAPDQGRPEPEIDWRIDEDVPDDRREVVEHHTEQALEEVHEWLGMRPHDFTVVVSEDPATLAQQFCDASGFGCDLEQRTQHWEQAAFEATTGSFYVRTSVDWWDDKHWGVTSVAASRGRDVAHETFHVIRDDHLSEDMGALSLEERRQLRGPEWLTSGMAMFVSAGVLDRADQDGFSYEEFAKGREEFVEDANEPSLADLQIWYDFEDIDSERYYPTDAGYAAGFLASEHLVFEHGSEAVTEFYTTLEDGVSASESFEQAFGTPLAEFEEEFSYPERPRD